MAYDLLTGDGHWVKPIVVRSGSGTVVRVCHVIEGTPALQLPQLARAHTREHDGRPHGGSAPVKYPGGNDCGEHSPSVESARRQWYWGFGSDTVWG
jgi:hypothetical protein